MFKHFEINEVGCDFVVGDIHGCFDQLREALLSVDFYYDTDRLFCVGDLVDRGDQSEECLDWLDKPWFHTIRGNHEQMAIDYLAGANPADLYLYNGGSWFIGLPYSEQRQIVDAFESLPIAMDIKTKAGLIGIVHAECPVADWLELEPALNGDRAALYVNDCMWDRTRYNQSITDIIENVSQIYVGHTPARDTKVLGNVNYIDTGAVFLGGYLTIVRID